MPFPNEIAARIISPDKFEQDSFRSKNIAPGVRIIVGKLKGQSTMSTQIYRFDSDKFTADEAREWLKKHNIKPIEFSPAEKDKPMKKAFIKIANTLFMKMNKSSQIKEGTKIEAEHKDTYKFLDDYIKKNGKLPPEKEFYKHIAENHVNGSGEEKGLIDYYTRLLSMEEEAKYDKKRPEIEILAIKFLNKNPNPSDSQIHAYAEKIGIEHSMFEAVVYRLATERAKMSKDMFKAQTIKYYSHSLGTFKYKRIR
jgi:sulfur relay (sulfurtransferase) DsrC/TusE family protein